MKNTIIYTITAIVCTLILGISLYNVQVQKQESIERQKRMEIEQQQAELDYKMELEQSAKNAELDRKLELDGCLEKSETSYWDYMRLNGTNEADGTITAPRHTWDEGQKRKDKLDDVCFKKFN